MFWTVFKFELAYWFKRPLTLLFFALFFLMAFFCDGVRRVPRHRDGSDPSQRAVRAGDRDGHPHRDRASDHDRDRRNRRVARRTARHRRDAVHDAPQQSGLSARPLRRRVRDHARDLLRAAGWTAHRHAHAVGPGRQAGSRSTYGRSSSRSSSSPLPNLLFVSALLFAVGALTRKLFAVYITGIILLVGLADHAADRRAARQAEARVAHRSVRAHDDRRRDPLLERRREEHAARSRSAEPYCRTGLIWIAIALALFAFVAIVFRLRLQHGRAHRKGEGTSDRRAGGRPGDACSSRCATTRASWLRVFFVAEPLSSPLDPSRATVPRDLGRFASSTDGRPRGISRIPTTPRAGR